MRKSLDSFTRTALAALLACSLPLAATATLAAEPSKPAAKPATQKVVASKKKKPSQQVSRYGSRRAEELARQRRAEQARMQALSRLPHRVGPTEIFQNANLDLPLNLESRAAVVMHAETGELLYSKNSARTMPIASITKLMTAIIVLDARLPLDEEITISAEDMDHLRHTTSRLAVGTRLTRGEAMLLALMSSENRAAAALARTYPGGTEAAVAAMNRKADELGMAHARFADGSGLNGQNMASPSDLVRLVNAANSYPEIREYSTTPDYTLLAGNRALQYRNTNGLVKTEGWDIAVSKTGFLNEAGKCLVMQAKVNETPVVIVLMDSQGRYTRIGDANRVKKWLEATAAHSGLALGSH